MNPILYVFAVYFAAMFELPEALDSILIDPTKLHFDPRSHPIGQGKNNK